MKCKDCPILKYDGEKYSCPANTYRGSITMYTDIYCNAMEWYPKFLRDQIDTLTTNICQLDDIMSEVWSLLTSYRSADGYLKLVADDIKSVYDKYADKREFMSQELDRLKEEIKRVTENVKTKEIPQERIHTTASEQQTDISTGS